MPDDSNTANDLLDYRENELDELPDARLYELLFCTVPESFSKLSKSFADERKARIARLLSWRKLYSIDGCTLSAANTKPIYAHDCTNCYLIKADTNGRDWYVCCHVSNVDEKHASVLIRYGENPEDYGSMNVAVLRYAFIRGDSNLEPYLNVLLAVRSPAQEFDTCNNCGRRFAGTGSNLCEPCVEDGEVVDEILE